MPGFGYILCSSNQRLYTHNYNRVEHTDPVVGLTGFRFRYLPYELPWMTRGWLSRNLRLCKHKIRVEDECLLRHRLELNFESKIQIFILNRRCVSALLCAGSERLSVCGRTPRHHRKPAPARRPRNTAKRAIEI